MSELEQYYRQFACVPSRWSDEDPELCGCHGSGWFLSEVDTFHKCPIHWHGQPHPEDETPFNEYCVSGLLKFFSQPQRRIDTHVELDEFLF